LLAFSKESGGSFGICPQTGLLIVTTKDGFMSGIEHPHGWSVLTPAQKQERAELVKRLRAAHADHVRNWKAKQAEQMKERSAHSPPG
jgi:hypothetical protein